MPRCVGQTVFRDCDAIRLMRDARIDCDASEARGGCATAALVVKLAVHG